MDCGGRRRRQACRRWFRVRQTALSGDGAGAQLWAYYETSSVYVGLLEYFNRDYNPGIGLELLDANYVLHSPAVLWDLRGGWLPENIRSFNPGISVYSFTSSDGGDLKFGYAVITPLRFDFHSGASVGVIVEPNWQRITDRFAPRPASRSRQVTTTTHATVCTETRIDREHSRANSRMRQAGTSMVG